MVFSNGTAKGRSNSIVSDFFEINFLVESRENVN